MDVFGRKYSGCGSNGYGRNLDCGGLGRGNGCLRNKCTALRAKINFQSTHGIILECCDAIENVFAFSLCFNIGQHIGYGLQLIALHFHKFGKYLRIGRASGSNGIVFIVRHRFYHFFHNFYFLYNFLDNGFGFLCALDQIDDSLIGQKSLVHRFLFLWQMEGFHIHGIGGFAFFDDQIPIMRRTVRIVLYSNTQYSQLRHRKLQLLGGILILFGAKSNGCIFLACQAILEKARQYFSVADFHKNTGSVLIGFFCARTEQNRPKQLLLKQIGNLIGIFLACSVCINLSARFTKLHIIQIFTERNGGFLHIRAVERTRNLQANRSDSHTHQFCFQFGNAFGASRNHCLSNAVFICNINVLNIFADLNQLGFIRHASHHSDIGIRFTHQTSAFLCHGNQRFVIHNTVCPKSNQFTEAMPDKGICFQPAFVYDFIQSCLRCSKYGLCIGSIVDCALCFAPFIGGERLGVENFGNGSFAVFQQYVICLADGGTQFGIVNGSLRKHIHRLCTLPGEQDSDLALILFAVVSNALLSKCNCGILFQEFQRNSAFFRDFAGRLCNESKTEQSGTCIFIAVFIRIKQFGFRSQRFNFSCQRLLAVSGKQNTYGRRAHTVCALMFGNIFLHNHVEIGSSKSKCADTCAADRLFFIDNPRL